MKFCVLKMQKLENAITADVRVDLREIISQQNCRCHRIIVINKPPIVSKSVREKLNSLGSLDLPR